MIAAAAAGSLLMVASHKNAVADSAHTPTRSGAHADARVYIMAAERAAHCSHCAGGL
jgi:hypothetical protein